MTSAALAQTTRRFWEWFTDNESELLTAGKGSRPLEDLGERLREVHPNLVWELRPPGSGPREFVISADGVREAFGAVETLASAAPPLPRWTVVPFRPRMPDYTRFSLRFGDLSLGSESIEAILLSNGDLLGVHLLIKGCPEENHPEFVNAAYIMMDMCLGEYDVVTKIGQFGVLPFDAHVDAPRIAWADLRRVFDDAFAHLQVRD